MLLYLKVTKVKDKEYLKIVESYWDKKEKKVKHKVIANLGRLDQFIGQSALIKKLIEKLSDGKYVEIDEINKDGNADNYNYGYIVLKTVWNRYKLNGFFKKVLENKKIKNDKEIIKTIFTLIVNRALFSEYSKHRYFNKKDYFLFLNEELKLHNLYLTLEVLEEIKEELELHLLNLNKNLFNLDLEVALYDVTTLYFESKREDADIEIKDEENNNTIETKKGLRKFGLSKDFKINEVQIVLSLLIDKSGIPITFEIYEGNRAETTTLLDTLDRLKNKFGLNKITIVADRGISKWLNLKEIKLRGYEYIVAISFKSKNLSEKILDDKKNYTQISFSTEKGYYGYKEFIITEEKRVKISKNSSLYDETLDKENKGYIYQTIPLTHKIVATYSDIRAKKDESDRNRAIENLTKKINNKTAIKKSKFIKITNNNENSSSSNNDDSCNIGYEIDFEAIKEDAKFDGYYALASSDTSLSALEIINIHKNIYDIENSFRDLKNTLSIRPIYHYKRERIIGHIIVSFLAYMFLKHIEISLKNSKKTDDNLKESITIENIKDSLLSMEVTKTLIKDTHYYLKNKHTKLASRIVDLFKINLPKNIVDERDIKDYILGF